MWAITGSPFALLFAVLGPIVALASSVDDRFQRRRELRSSLADHAAEVEAALVAIEAEHVRERAELESLALLPHRLLRSTRDPEWWRATLDSAVLVCLGAGAVPSGIRLQRAQPAANSQGDAADALEAASATIADAPVLVDARDGVGIVGRGVAAGALARSVVSQLAYLLSPSSVGARVSDDGCFDWVKELPHHSGAPAEGIAQVSAVEFVAQNSEREARVVCVIAEREEQLPRACRVVVLVEAEGTAQVVRNPSGPLVRGIRPSYVSDAQARALARRASEVATSDGLVPRRRELPSSMPLDELDAAVGREGALPATIGVSAEGPVTIDLVGDGQHAVVGGTTGAGKSELLVTWIVGMCLATPPSEVNLLLVDFKGGSSFAPIEHLPHTVGMITDLDQPSAHRALLSLRAELRHRERTLARGRAKAIDELPSVDRLPRLVIVVDEYAVVVNEFPELQPLFADLVARGRSLGVHLILCTQRPAGTVRDAVLANCSLRLSLRVTDAADSSAVIGSPAAAELPHRPFGRCYLNVAGTGPVLVQVALSGPGDPQRVRDRWPAVPLRRPWCEPLPKLVGPDELAPLESDGALVFGMADVPENQCRVAATFEPMRDGNLLIFGGHGSGKSTALAAIRDAAAGTHDAVLVSSSGEAAWETLLGAVAGLRNGAGRPPTLCLFDDVDAMIGGLPDDYRLPFIDQLARLLREGPGLGVHTVLTAARSVSSIHSLVALCDSRLLLQLPSRQEHLLCGGEAERYLPQAPAGRGEWKGHRVQVTFAELEASHPRPPQLLDLPAVLEQAGSLAIVAANPELVVERLRSSGFSGEVIVLNAVAAAAPTLSVHGGANARIVVADPPGWQANWTALTTFVAGGTALFVGCGVAEFRALVGSRDLPPLLAPGPGEAVLRHRDGTMHRVRLPKPLAER
jgi:S-DNA-T family DNA segregation ATPase FtsK/SpoIIIE